MKGTEIEQPAALSPIFRWAGSKRRLASRIAQYWHPSFARYVEPFAGSACLFFFLQPKAALLSDINGDLIETYSTIKRNPKAVHSRLSQIPLGRESYYQLRASRKGDLSTTERAARFIFLNRFCFNGLYRTNLAGAFNVPYSPRKTGQLPALTDLQNIARKLQTAQILQSDFEETIDSTVAGDFIYADPPYAISEARVFREYHPNSFAVSDIPRFANCLNRAAVRGVKVVVTYADSADFRAAFSGWDISEVITPRNISGFAKHRKLAIELIATTLH
jgi:DNA adenine methylase